MKALLLAALFFSLAAPARAQDMALQGAGSPGSLVSIDRYLLPNGLEVLLLPDRHAPLVTVSVSYQVGSADEPPDRLGLSHLCEHLMFRGSKHVGGSHGGALSEAGDVHHNGATTFHRTSYFETVPNVNLATALWLESDRMGFLGDALDQDKLAAEREVVKNERRQLFDAAPYGLAEERLWHALFPAPHPYHGLVIGSPAHLDRVTLADVRAFLRRFYTPRNATLTLVGDFEPARARALVQKYFGSLPAGPAGPAGAADPAGDPARRGQARRGTAPPPLQRPIEIHHVERVGGAPRVMIAWHSPALYEPGDTTAQVLAAMLSASRASRLQRRLGRLASSVTAAQDSLRLQSVFKISVLARPGADLRRIVREIDAVLDELREGQIPEEEVRRASLRLRTQGAIEMQETAQQARRLLLLSREGDGADRAAVAQMGPLGLLRYTRVTPAEVSTLLREVLLPSRRVVLYAVPAPEEAASR